MHVHVSLFALFLKTGPKSRFHGLKSPAILKIWKKSKTGPQKSAFFDPISRKFVRINGFGRIRPFPETSGPFPGPLWTLSGTPLDPFRDPFGPFPEPPEIKIFQEFDPKLKNWGSAIEESHRYSISDVTRIYIYT